MTKQKIKEILRNILMDPLECFPRIHRESVEETAQPFSVLLTKELFTVLIKFPLNAAATKETKTRDDTDPFFFRRHKQDCVVKGTLKTIPEHKREQTTIPVKHEFKLSQGQPTT